MKTKRGWLNRRFALLLVGTFALGATAGACGGSPSDSEETDALVAALMACHLYDGTVDKKAEIRACTPEEETHKTTICHIPPGNPANAHTLCIGNQAVPAHLDNHGDYLGPCKTEQPCPPPPPPATGTGGGAAGQSGGATGGSSGGLGGAITIG
jgi:hypothetical protein